MLEPVLNVEILRVAAFTRPDGFQRLLGAVAARTTRVPAEVYNRDESDLPLTADDGQLSELAKSLRYVQRRAESRRWPDAQPDHVRLMNAAQLASHIAHGSLVVDPLMPDELPRREDLRERYGIGRGEAACLVLAQRYGAEVVFLSPGGVASRAAESEGVRYLALRDAAAA